MKIGFARFARRSECALQRRAIYAVSCEKAFKNQTTGATFNREGMSRAIAAR